MTISKPSPISSSGAMPDPSPSSMPPDSSSVEPRSSRFTVVSVIVVVEQDGERHSLHFEGGDVESVKPEEWITRWVIGVDSVRVAEALEGR